MPCSAATDLRSCTISQCLFYNYKRHNRLTYSIYAKWTLLLQLFWQVSFLYKGCLVSFYVPHIRSMVGGGGWGWGGGGWGGGGQGERRYTVFSLSVIPWFQLHFHSISWEQNDGIRPNFALALMLISSTLGLLRVNFRTFSTWLWPFCYRQNFVSAQYLVNKLMEFDKSLYMHWP